MQIHVRHLPGATFKSEVIFSMGKCLSCPIFETQLGTACEHGACASVKPTGPLPQNGAFKWALACISSLLIKTRSI